MGDAETSTASVSTESNVEALDQDEHSDDVTREPDLLQCFRAFVRTKGTKAIVFITLFYALGVGCVVGVVSTRQDLSSHL